MLKESWRAWLRKECVSTLWEMLKLGKTAEPGARQAAGTPEQVMPWLKEGQGGREMDTPAPYLFLDPN